jgi:Mn-dependent DtxR family transcriptional regulator
MMELLTFINLNTPPGATITGIQSQMLKIYGLKFRTTSEMVQELAVSGALKVDGHGFYRLTEKQQTAYKTQVAQEKAQDMVGPLVRRIDRVKDDRTRQRLETLAAKLTELLEKTEEEEGSELT